MEDIEAIRFTKGRYAAYALWIIMTFTVVLVVLTSYQISGLRADRNYDDFAGLAIVAIGFFAIAIPTILTLILIPCFISSIKWFKGRYTKYTKASIVTSMVVSILYSLDLGLITVANFSDGYYIQGVVEIMGMGLCIFLIVRCIIFLISMKGYQ